MIIFTDKEGFHGDIRKRAFQHYLMALSIIFIVFFFLDLLVDLITPLWISAIIPFFFIIPLILSRYGVKTDFLITFNVSGLLLVFQLLFILNPKHYYVLIYWFGLIPLLIVSMVKPKAAKIWGLIFLGFFIVNGIYVFLLFPSYQYMLFPKKYLAAGFVFWMIAFSLVFIINRIQDKNKKILLFRNEELTNLKQQIENKNNELEFQNKQINTINEKLKNLNDNLENSIKNRTKDLEQRNVQLTEYAFINSHLLRAPVARVIGLIDVFSKSKSDSIKNEILGHLKQASVELDEIVSQINKVLDEERDHHKKKIL